MFKKIISSALCLSILLSISIPAFANELTEATNQDVVVTYGMNESFVVSIPSSLPIDSTGKATATVSASNVMIASGSTLEVSVSGDDYVDSWELVDAEEASNTLTYTIGTSEEADDIVNGSTVLSVAAGEAYDSIISEVLHFTVIDDLAKSGEYTDTLTFTVVIDDGVYTPEELVQMYTFTYYSSLSDALGDVEDSSVGTNAAEEAADSKIAVYTDENDNTCVVLLDDYDLGENQIAINSDVTINLGGHTLSGAANGVIVVNSGEVVINAEVDGSQILAEATEDVVFLRALRLLGGNTTVIGGSFVAVGDYGMGNVGTQGISVGANATATLIDVYAYGVHAGLQANSSVIVEGGIFEGYGHGGIYFNGSNSTSYVKDAIIRQADMPEGWEDIGGGCNKTGMYIGGTGGKEYITVYMDNCTISGDKNAIALRGSNDEKYSSLYISNSTINLDYTEEGVRIDNDTHSLYIGSGNNFDATDTDRESVCYDTGEVYRY